jgi:hypothetical protein
MNILDACVAFGAAAGGAAALVTFVAPVHRMERGLIAIWRTVNGVPAGDGHPAQPGVMERLTTQDQHLATQDTQLAEIRAELGKLKRRP